MEKSPINLNVDDEWRKIGAVQVDTGRLVILDPCYLQECAAIEDHINDLSVQDFYKTLEDAGLIDDSMTMRDVREVARVNQHKRKLHAEFAINDRGATAIVTHSGFGDGIYPIHARIVQTEKNGPRVAGIWIDFEIEE